MNLDKNRLVPVSVKMYTFQATNYQAVFVKSPALNNNYWYNRTANCDSLIGILNLYNRIPHKTT